MTSGSEPTARRLGSNSGGYAYLLLLMLVAGITTLAGYSLEWGASSHRREAEGELLRIGAEFERALLAYASSGSANDPLLSGPPALEQLLKDDRQPQARRHLRKMYKDPLTGSETWGMVRGPGGTIWGIYSLAKGTPQKQKGFPASMAHLEGAESYADWVFGLPQAKTLKNPGKPPSAPLERSAPAAPPPNNPPSGAPT